jgi:signal transduction histidine kinase
MKANHHFMTPLEQAELNDRLQWFVRLRWLFGFSLFAVGMVLSYFPFNEVHGPTITVLGVIILAYNSLFWYVDRYFYKKHPEKLPYGAPIAAHAQIICDLLVLTAVLHYSGGIENPFSAYYIFHIVIATFLLPTGSVFALAIAAIVMFASMSLAEMYGWLDHTHIFIARPHYQDPVFVAVALLAFGSSLLIAVYLGTSIAGRLRSREQEVIELEKELEQRADELEEANEALRQADEAKTAHFRRVSHELKAPAHAQLTLLKTLRMELKDTHPQAKQRIDRAIARGEELGSLMSDLLTLSKAREAKHRLSCEWTDPMDKLQSVLENQEMQAREKGLEFKVTAIEPVPPICSEPGSLGTIVQNLLSNAIKYTPGGGSVSISLYGQNEQLIIKVEDTGIGISKEDLEKIGQEFFRTEQARNTGQSGTGLGITIVRNMVEAMQGSFNIESEANKGTTVSVAFPVARSDIIGECGRTVPVKKEEAQKT